MVALTLIPSDNPSSCYGTIVLPWVITVVLTIWHQGTFLCLRSLKESSVMRHENCQSFFVTAISYLPDQVGIFVTM